MFGRRHWGIALLFVFLILAFAACSGGSTSTTDIVQDNQPGVVIGDVSGADGVMPQPGIATGGTGGTGGGELQFSSENFVPSSQLAGSSDYAPLGTNPEYNTRPLGAVEVLRTASKVGSALGEGEQVKIDWLAVTRHLADGMSPEGLPGFSSTEGLNEGPFTEGEAIDIWLAYEVADGNTLSREWRFTCDETMFSFTLVDDMVTYVSGGDNEPGAKLFKLTYMV